jgi:hypothetical protein
VIRRVILVAIAIAIVSVPFIWRPEHGRTLNWFVTLDGVGEGTEGRSALGTACDVAARVSNVPRSKVVLQVMTRAHPKQRVACSDLPSIDDP